MSKKLPFVFVTAFLVVLAAGFLGGFVVGRWNRSVGNDNDATALFMGDSAVVKARRVEVEGRLIEKTGTSITLERGEDRLSIPLLSSSTENASEGLGKETIFIDERFSEEPPPRIRLEEIPLGTVINGFIEILEDRKSFVGTVFSVISSP